MQTTESTESIETITGIVMYETIKDPKSEFYRMSAEKCFLNKSCACCTCSCCALCLMILWIIGGILGIWGAYSVLQWKSNGELYTESCEYNGISYDDCCISNQGLYGSTNKIEILDINCDKIETAYTISLVDCIC